MAELSLKVKSRERSTKGELNRFRKDGFVPGVYYSTEVEPVSILASEISLKPLIFTSETHIINLSVDDKEPKSAILKDVQFHPITDRIVHFDLLGLTKGHKITVPVPVILTGTAVGVKDEGGILQHQSHKLDVECLPKDLPDHIEVNVDHLKIGMSVQVKDIELENLKIVNHENTIIVSVEKTRVMEVEEVDEIEGVEGEEDSVEPEVISKGKSEEDGE